MLEAGLIRELHIDVHRISDEQISALIDAGFHEDCFTAAGGGLERPAHHFTWETMGAAKETKNDRDAVLERAVKILGEGKEFLGYIESEIIPEGFQVAYRDQPFDPAYQFAVERFSQEKTRENKIADLHFKVPLKNTTRALEEEFERLGIYFVETPKGNRIYTLQFLSQVDGKRAFEFFRKAIAHSGGVVELTYEICDAFIRIPRNLPAPTVVSKDGVAAAMVPLSRI